MDCSLNVLREVEFQKFGQNLSSPSKDIVSLNVFTHSLHAANLLFWSHLSREIHGFSQLVNRKWIDLYGIWEFTGTASKSAGIEKIKCLLHQPGETTTVHVQNVNSTEKYITGTYDLEVTTLPRTIVKDVKVEQSKTTDVLIPAPGIVTLNKSFEAYGGLFIVENGKMKKIYDLQLQDKQETLALQPGKYHLVYRSKYARTIHTTVDKEFEITTGGSLSLKL